jgi:hypothetical protein
MAEIHFSIDRGRFKGLSLTARRAERLAYFDAHDLTAQERLLYQVWASPSLRTRVFTGGQLVLSAQASTEVRAVCVRADGLRLALEQEPGLIRPVFESVLLQLYLQNDLTSRGHPVLP